MSAWTKTEICNLALSHAGSGYEIADVTTEKSNEARACRRFYEICKDSMLRQFVWPFATKFETLTLIEEDPNDEWAYSYDYPSDALFLRRILSGSRVDTRDTRIPYKIVADDSNLVLYTDAEDPVIEYTKRIDDASRFPSDFVMALSLRLAYYIAPRLTGVDIVKVRTELAKIFKDEMSNASFAGGAEQAPDLSAESEFITER
jgi:hypothetical protein